MALRFSLPVFLGLACRIALGCPDCNIHNFLAASICSSRNIYVAKILKAVDEHTVEVKVVRVLRGQQTVGAQQQVGILWYRNDDIGREFIFSDPKSGPPNFEFLPADMEDEVRFLMGFGTGTDVCQSLEIGIGTGRNAPRPPRIKDLQEAILRCQGMSNQSRQLGLEYIQSLPDHPTEKLIEAIEKLRVAGPSGSYQATYLVVALMLKPQRRIEEYVFDQLRRFIFAAPRSMDWNDIPESPSESGLFITALIGATGERWSPAYFPRYASPEKEPLLALRLNQRMLLLGALPHLDEAAIADVTFALCSTNAARPQELVELATTDTIRNGVGLGLLYLAAKHAGVFAWQEARADVESALQVARLPSLRAKLEARAAGLPKTQPGR